MPRVVITHAVEDIDRWLQGKAERAAAIESGTGSNVTDYVANDGSSNVAITAESGWVEDGLRRSRADSEHGPGWISENGDLRRRVETHIRTAGFKQ